MAAAARTYYAATRVEGPATPGLSGVVEVETCIVGGGLAGLSTALDLAERGRSVALVEAHGLGWGASGRNGGFVVSGFPAGNLSLARKIGNGEARALFDLSRLGQRLVAERIARYALAGVDRRDGAIRCALAGQEGMLDRQRRALADIFGLELDLVGKDELRGLLTTDRYGGGLVNRETFSVHPLNLALGLAGAAQAQGALIYENAAATGLDLDGPEKRVRTATGEVRARNVVLTCGGYIGLLCRPLTVATVPIATFVIVTAPAPEALDRAITTPMAISDLQFATNYYRRLPGGRLLWGGRVKAWEPGPQAIARALARDMTAFYPALRGVPVEYAWGGRMSYLRHHMPVLGRLRDGVWYATGFGGLGLALTAMAGRLLGAAIDEGDETWRRFARFGLPFAGGVLGRVPAQLQYWSLALAARLGRVTAVE